MPLLTMGGEKSSGPQLAEQAKLFGSSATTIVLKGTGHWVLEESAKETTDVLINSNKKRIIQCHT
jgi:hypothetical protein